MQRLRAVSTPEQLSWTAGNAGLVACGVVAGGLSIGFGTYGQPHLMVRFMALRDEKALRQARAITILWYLVVFGGMCLAGLLGHVLLPAVANPETVFCALADSLFSPVLGAILLAAVLAAIMSTADSQLLVAASAIAHDLGLGRSRAQHRLSVSRLTIVGLVLCGHRGDLPAGKRSSAGCCSPGRHWVRLLGRPCSCGWRGWDSGRWAWSYRSPRTFCWRCFLPAAQYPGRHPRAAGAFLRCWCCWFSAGRAGRLSDGGGLC